MKKKKIDNFLTDLEKKIQERARNKDKNFVLSGSWKKFIRIQDDFSIFAVEGEWVRNNLGVLFRHGGHGYVHEFIPLDEIWVETHHFDGCGCKNLKQKDQQVSPEYFESTIVHEITEFRAMEKGKPYHEAHEVALEKERGAGLLKDPYAEVD